MPVSKQPSWTSSQDTFRHGCSQDTFRNDLQDVSLDDGKDLPATPPGRRPDAFRAIIFEALFVAIIAFSAASPAFLHRSLLVTAAQIGDALNMSPAELAWITSAPGLITGALLIPLGYVADVLTKLSRKYMLLLSLVALSLNVMIASFSPNGTMFDVMSGLAGIACAANIPLAVGLLDSMYPLPSRRKSIVFSTLLMGNPMATIISGLSSGLLIDSFSWKAPFFFLAILYAAFAVLGLVFIPRDNRNPIQLDNQELPYRPLSHLDFDVTRKSLGAKSVRSFDWFGLVLLISGVLMFTTSLTIAPESAASWQSPATISLMTVGLLLLAALIFWECKTKTPLIPHCVWEDQTLILILLTILASSMAYNSALFWISVFLQQVGNLTAFDVAVRLLPQAFIGVFVSPLAGLAMRNISGTRLVVVAAACSVSSNLLLVFVQAEGTYFSLIFPSLLLSTIGMDWMTNIGSLHILSVVQPDHQSIGTSLVQTVSRLGIPLGLAITTAVWSSYENLDIDNGPEVAFSKAFVTTTVISGLTLLVTPFLRVQPQVGGQKIRLEAESQEAKHHSTRPSKRWSIGPDTASDRSTLSVSIEAAAKLFPTPNNNQKTPHRERPDLEKALPGLTPAEKVIWIVCESCGRSQRILEQQIQRRRAAHPKSDPSEYFNDLETRTPVKRNHDMIINGRGRVPRKEVRAAHAERN